METVHGIDVSVYSGAISAPTWNELKAKGVELCVVGLWHGASVNRHAPQQLAGAAGAGIGRAGYVALAGAHNGQDDVIDGLKPLDYPDLAFVAIDVELPAVTPDMLSFALGTTRALGYRAIIYTGAWFWNWLVLRERDYFAAHPGTFSDVPVWLADYDHNPALDTQPLAHLGRVVGKQYAGTTEYVPGCIVDLNTFDATWLVEEAVEMQERMRAVERELDLAHQKATMRLALEAWLAQMGGPLEDRDFQEFCRSAIFWRIEQHGWTGPRSW